MSKLLALSNEDLTTHLLQLLSLFSFATACISKLSFGLTVSFSEMSLFSLGPVFGFAAISWLCRYKFSFNGLLPASFLFVYLWENLYASRQPSALLICIMYITGVPVFMSVYIQSLPKVLFVTFTLMTIQVHHAYRLTALPDEEIVIVVKSFPIFAAIFTLFVCAGSYLIGVLHRQYVERIVDLLKRANISSVAKDTFVALMSHEIRNPLNALLGCLHILSISPCSNEQKEILSMANCCGDFLLSLVSSVLDLTRLDDPTSLAIHEVPCHLKSILLRAVGIFENQCRAKAVTMLPCNFNGLPETVMCDGDRLMQVLVNLLGNAVKFTEKGHVSLTATWKPIQHRTGELSVIVEDSGIGLTPEVQEKLFERFSQGDSSVARKYGGTGLGLYLSRQLLRLMGCELRYTTEPGKGTKFFFTLQLNLAEAKVQDKESKFSDKPPLGLIQDMQILVVDDSPMNCKILSRMLQTWQCRPESSLSGSDAIQRMLQQDWDLVFLDLQMPEVDGFTVIRQYYESIRKSGRARVPIAVLTGNTTEEDRSLCLDLGVYAFLAKPVCAENLYQLLLELKQNQNRTKRILYVTEYESIFTPPAILRQGYIVLVSNHERVETLFTNSVWDLVLVDLDSESTALSTVKQVREVELIRGWKPVPIICFCASSNQEQFTRARCDAILDRTVGDIQLAGTVHELLTRNPNSTTKIEESTLQLDQT